MITNSERAKQIVKIRWGDKLVCRLTTRDGVQVATCKWNGESVVGRGKNNLSALKAVFKKIND